MQESLFMKKETPTQVFSIQFREIFKNTYFVEHVSTGACDSYKFKNMEKYIQLWKVTIKTCRFTYFPEISSCLINFNLLNCGKRHKIKYFLGHQPLAHVCQNVWNLQSLTILKNVVSFCFYKPSGWKDGLKLELFLIA